MLTTRGSHQPRDASDDRAELAVDRDCGDVRVTLGELVEAVAALTYDSSELVLVVQHILASRATWAAPRPRAELSGRAQS